MKLKDEFITHYGVDGTVLLATGDEAKNFHGIVKLNETAAKIVEMLKKETTVDEIVSSLSKEYSDTDSETIKKDVENIISQLESIHAIIK